MPKKTKSKKSTVRSGRRTTQPAKATRPTQRAWISQGMNRGSDAEAQEIARAAAKYNANASLELKTARTELAHHLKQHSVKLQASMYVKKAGLGTTQ